MKLSVSAYRAHAAAHKKILSSGYHTQLNYGSTGAAGSASTSAATGLYAIESNDGGDGSSQDMNRVEFSSDTDVQSPLRTSPSAQEPSGAAPKHISPTKDDENSNNNNLYTAGSKNPSQRSASSSPTICSHSDSTGVRCAASHPDEADCRLDCRTSSTRRYTEEDESALSHHSSPDHRHRRRHVKLLLNSPSAECVSRIIYVRSGGSKCEPADQRANAASSLVVDKFAGGGGAAAPPPHSAVNQRWSSLRAVMAYYGSLRRIKRTRSNQRWMKLRTTVQISSAIQKKPPLKREDSFLKRFSTRQIPETQETVEDTGSESASGELEKGVKRRRRYLQKRRSVVNPDENFYFYWLMALTTCVLYNLWTLIVRQSFPELQRAVPSFWFGCDLLTDVVFVFDILVQLRTGYLEQGLMVYDDKKLACHYVHSRDFFLDIIALVPLDLLQIRMGTQPLLRFTRFFKVYRSVKFYYIVESRTVWPNLWRVVNLIHILLILAHWFGCFYYLLSEAEGFQGDWVYPYRPGDYATLTRKYLGSLYWSTLTLTTIGDLPTPETNAEYIFTIVSYLIGVFIFATIVGQVGNVITNRNANRLEFERLLDGAKTYMRHHKVPGGMKRRVLRWYDYSWSRGRIQGGGDINTALGLLPDKLKTELALHVNLSVLKKVTIFQECQPEFLHDLVLKMKAYIFTPGDSICRRGEVAREMFIIADGILEVISETGKVLTTMKAGDFFGEIGILNLDGLNKRTADVRSVGYSELFSLSREDVLTAMKDYPEAQEILQTLGRKRLMEVRCVNKKYAKAQMDKEAARASKGYHGPVVHSDSSETSASKKIVNKLRHDVKGFRSVLKKSRTSRRSDESLEMQPLHNASPKNVKCMLKRMSRVRSEDREETTEDKENQHDSTPSPIGAGLPLLQRLRLLKEKQESIQEEPERELNEGLPLLQRLQQLKIKHDAPLSEAKQTVSSPPPPPPPPPLLPNQLDSAFGAAKGSVANRNNNSSSGGPSNSSSSSLTVAQIKPIMKVSFRQRLQTVPQSTESDTNPVPNEGANEGAANESAAAKPPKTLPVVQFGQREEEVPLRQQVISENPDALLKPSLSTSPLVSDTDPALKPWSKLKLATLVSASYTSLATAAYSPQDPCPLTRNYSAGNLPERALAEERASAPSRRNAPWSPLRSRVAAKAKATANKAKLYQSVFDLSPEYSGLPFVKRLKILNERQKLAELEKAIQVRSFSLDNSKTEPGAPPLTEALSRCFSDTSGIYSQFVSTYESSSTTSTNTSTSENSKKSKTLHRLDSVQHDYSPLSPEAGEAGEAGETLERRRLKSILKSMNKRKAGGQGSEAAQAGAPGGHSHSAELPKEPTVAGPPGNSKQCAYVANKAPFGDPLERCAQEQSLFRKQGQRAPAADSVAAGSEHSRSFLSNSTLAHLPAAGEARSQSGSQPKLPSNQMLQLEDLGEGQEYLNRILSSINSVIKAHVNEMRSRFESQFTSMASEVRQKDAIIATLQRRVRSLELKTSPSRRKLNCDPAGRRSLEESANLEGNSSSGSSAELLFMRGDSLDTVFSSSSPVGSRHRLCSPSRSNSKQLDESAFFKSSRDCKNERLRTENSSMMVSEVTGNLKRVPDSIVLDLGESSSSSSSSLDKLNKEEEEEEEGAELSSPVHHNDWEVRMLAAEMEKQERKRGNSLSDHLEALRSYESILRRHRKLSDTETECSDGEVSATASFRARSRPPIPAAGRPRASSLDQFNLRYGASGSDSRILKAMSIDRGRDKF